MTGRAGGRSLPVSLGVGAALFAVYVATLAPGVTFWDAGEFIAAAHTLGIPHPPGTPLYVLVAHVWSRALGFLPTAAATNLLSAVCTAAAGAVCAGLVARWTGSRVAGAAAGLCAGAMSTVWSSATETEVYAASMLLACLTMLAAERAHGPGDSRWRLLAAYGFGLAAALHVSALVAGPAAIWLGLRTGDADRPSEPVAPTLALGAAYAAAIAVGVASVGAGAAAVALLAAALAAARGRPRAPLAALPLLALPLAALVGASAIGFLIARAPHDPAINQGNPSTLAALVGVVGRRQYAVAGLWPRQAPVWLQAANFLEYVDWQVALGLAPGVTPSPWRTPVTVAYLALAAVGFAWHRRRDRRSWEALTILEASASVGVLAYLNFKAGPSIGWGILPDSAPHEPRERDYFFALAFWCWGLWAGMGGVALAARLRSRRRAVTAGLAAAALPVALNWRAMDRRRSPDAELPREFAQALIQSAPERAVLFVAGDNDSYPLWYLQQVEGLRRDVTTITMPLLGAEWYRAELRRRHGLGDAEHVARWYGTDETVRALASSARLLGRPVAASVAAQRDERAWMAAPGWRLRGLVYASDSEGWSVDSAFTGRLAAELAPRLAREPGEGIDHVPRFTYRLLQCPSAALRKPADSAARALLDSTCNSP